MDLVYPRESTLFRIAAALSILFWVAVTLVTFGVVWLYVAFFALFMLFAQAGFVTWIRGTAVEVSEEQYPHIHKQLLRCCEKTGVTVVPECYVLRTDFFNALATRFLGREVIVLFSDVVDALEDRPEAVDFYIGHELGHVHQRHLLWSPWLLPVTWLPIFGAAYERAQESTCDRYGARCCANEQDVVAAIAAGNSLRPSFNVDAYIAQTEHTGGFWMSLNEITAGYPWLTKRMARALAFHRNQDWKAPGRHPLAWLLALFLPNVGGGGLGGLIIVAAVVGILAAVALPAYNEYVAETNLMRAQTQLAQGSADIEAVQDELLEYLNANEDWPTSLGDLGYNTESIMVSGGYRLSISGLGTIHVEFDELPDQFNGTVDPLINENTLVWDCGSETLDMTVVPGCE